MQDKLNMAKLAEAVLTAGQGLPAPTTTDTVPAYDTCTDRDGTTVELLPIESSQMQSIGYNSAAQHLLIKFRTGSVYSYDNVPDIMFRDFLGAESKGRYFAASIKHRTDLYPFTKLTDPEPGGPRVQWPTTAQQLQDAGWAPSQDRPGKPQHGNCSSCGAPIWWWITPAKRYMPLVYVVGNDLLLQSHFADCPNAKQHRADK